MDADRSAQTANGDARPSDDRKESKGDAPPRSKDPPPPGSNASSSDPLLAGAALGTTQGAIGATAGNDELIGRGDPSPDDAESTHAPHGQDPAIDPETGELRPPAEQA